VQANGPLVPGSPLALLNRLTFSLFQGFLDFQYLIRARKHRSRETGAVLGP
jgi:hypothetical protein